MNGELSDLILTICPHEQANAKQKNRVESVETFFVNRGACVEYAEINIKDGNRKTSMDYSLFGFFRETPINIAFSAKTITDMANSISLLPDELARGFLHFDHVGFILITGIYKSNLHNDELHAVIVNEGATLRNRDDRANILNMTSLFNALESWQMSGVHCRQILYEEDFPKAMISILNFITKDHHEGLNFCTKAVSNPSEKAKMDFVNAHAHLGVSGFGVKTALKLWDYLVGWNYPPNLHFASSLAEEDLIEALGGKTGKTLYETYRNRNGWIDVKKSSEEANRSLPERKLPEPKGNMLTESKNDSNKKITELNNNKDNKLQSSSAEHLELAKNRTCARPSSESNGIIGTPDNSKSSSGLVDADQAASEVAPIRKSAPDTLQSSEVSHTPIASVDTLSKDMVQSHDTKRTLDSGTAGETILPPLDLSPPAVASSKKETVKSLEDAIIDRVYAKPEIDTVIMREFMSRGFQMLEIHKVIKESSKLHKYKQGRDMMIAYRGVRADKEIDVGV